MLVVEDEPLLRMLAADILKDAGYGVLEAWDACEGLSILEGRDDIRAVLTDIEVPGDMDGLDLAASIRARWPRIAVLVTSGRIRPAAALPRGADFLEKPYLADELLGRLAHLLAVGPRH